MATQNENIEPIQESFIVQVQANANFQLTHGQVDKVQGIPDSEIDDAKHRSTVRDLGL